MVSKYVFLCVMPLSLSFLFFFAASIPFSSLGLLVGTGTSSFFTFLPRSSSVLPMSFPLLPPPGCCFLCSLVPASLVGWLFTCTPLLQSKHSFPCTFFCYLVAPGSLFLMTKATDFCCRYYYCHRRRRRCCCCCCCTITPPTHAILPLYLRRASESLAAIEFPSNVLSSSLPHVLHFCRRTLTHTRTDREDTQTHTGNRLPPCPSSVSFSLSILLALNLLLLFSDSSSTAHAHTLTQHIKPHAQELTQKHLRLPRPLHYL